MNKTNNLSCFFFHNVKTEQEFSIPTCVLNSVFSLLTCVGNVIILHATRKASDLHSPSVILLCFLAVSDFLVGAICQPSFVAYKIAGLVDNFSVYCTYCHIWLPNVWSILSLSSYSVHWSSSCFNSSFKIQRNCYHPSGIPSFSCCLDLFDNICCVKVLVELWKLDFSPLSNFPCNINFDYLESFKIFQIVRRHQRQIQSQTMAATSRTNTMNVLKCKKSAVTVLYVYGLFLLFYLPFCVTMIVNSLVGYTKWVKIAYDYASTAVFVNSCLDPLVYCWRMKKVRRAVKRAYRRQWRNLQQESV